MEKGLGSQSELQLRDVTLSPWQLFLEMNWFKIGGRYPEMYSFLSFELLHNLKPVISKMMKCASFSTFHRTIC